MVEEAQAEDFKAGAGIQFGAVDHLQGRGHLPVEAAGDVVENYGAVEDGPVPVLLTHIFPGEVGAGHLDDSPPGAFGETVGALYLGGGGDDLGLVVVDPPEALYPHNFAVEVSVELVGEMADIRPELGEGVDDFF